jgi:hypothetical protein
MTVQCMLILRDPGSIALRQLLPTIRANHCIRSTSPRLQAALGEVTVGIRDIGPAGRAFQPETEARRNRF